VPSAVHVVVDDGDDVGFVSPGAERTVVVDEDKAVYLFGHVGRRCAQLVDR
jgi:hypothetical protein